MKKALLIVSIIAISFLSHVWGISKGAKDSSKQRYFLVAWSSPKANGITSVTSKKYINAKEFKTDLKEEDGIEESIITNIIELNKKDFKSYIDYE